MSALAALRKATTNEHQRVERLPWSLAMLCGLVDVARYTTWLSLLLAFHERYEPAIERSRDGRVAAVRPLLTPHAPRLRGDLDALARLFGLAPSPLSPSALAALAPQRDLDGAFLLGVIYTLEGSTLGAQVLRPRLRSALGLPDEALNYYTGLGPATRGHFLAIASLLDQLLAGPAVEQAASGALWAFSTLGLLMEEPCLLNPCLLNTSLLARVS